MVQSFCLAVRANQSKLDAIPHGALVCTKAGLRVAFGFSPVR
jgi:hypothetical protein